MDNMDAVKTEENGLVNSGPGTEKTEKQKKKKGLKGYLAAKIAAYLLLAGASFVTAVSVLLCILAMSLNLYDDNPLNVDEAVLKLGEKELQEAAYTTREYIQDGMAQEAIQHYFSDRNIDVDIFRLANEWRVWGTYDGTYNPAVTQDYYLMFDRKKDTIFFGRTSLSTMDTYRYRIYVNPEYPHNDNFKQFYQIVLYLNEYRYASIWTALAGGIVIIVCFIFLMCSSGHRHGIENALADGRYKIYLEILAGGLVLGLVGLYFLCVMVIHIFEKQGVGIFLLIGQLSAIIAVAVLWLTFCLYIAARQIKQKKWWHYTLVYLVLRGIFKLLKWIGIGCFFVFGKIPMILKPLAVFFGISILEFVVCQFFATRQFMVFWLLEKLVLLPVVVYLALCCKRILDASEALAEGRQDYTLDTTLMIGDMKHHGENLNSIGQGISKAVEARMKSERLKTELITNVSHDLKTPLTSIINYAKLISEEPVENEKITEYSEVLLRQSERLKKLLEDLVEASKANTGNLEVNLVPCEVGVILAQATGEYQHRLEEKGLELRTAQMEESLRIMADGRHLWRVFDNLLNNICKYAQEGSRVYLNVEQHEKQVQIIFRNMSKYSLSMSAEELEERFVRGDKSRHMEGNGLGLSIAKSLVELQNGRMEIVIDGDLFKVILTFPQLN